jgi:ribonuclease VapC
VNWKTRNGVAEVVIDSSVALAFLFNEPGAEEAAVLMGDACMSAVNLAEVVTKLIDRGIPGREAMALASQLECAVVDLDAPTGSMAGAIRSATRHLGLSLGDRACLALARTRGLCAVTADRAWSRLGPDFDIRMLR